MRALVTGSTGFIGSHLCGALLDEGYQVTAFRRKNSPLRLIDTLPIDHCIGDVTDLNSLERAMKGIDIVFHAAAQLGKATTEQTYAVTVIGTRNVMRAAMQAGVQRVIHTSSVAALGVPSPCEGGLLENAESTMINENHSWNYPANWWRYGYAKHRAEMEVQFAVANGLDVVIVNPTVVIGAGDINRISGEVLLRVANRNLMVATEGGLNATHIDDTVRGHLAALERGKTGHRYILGSENMTHLEFLTRIARIADVDPPRFLIPAGLLRMLVPLFSLLAELFSLPFSPEAARKVGFHFYYDTRRASSELGISSTKSVDSAILESLTWYREGLTNGLRR